MSDICKHCETEIIGGDNTPCCDGSMVVYLEAKVSELVERIQYLVDHYKMIPAPNITKVGLMLNLKQLLTEGEG